MTSYIRKVFCWVMSLALTSSVLATESYIYQCVHTNKRVTIDGRLDEWKGSIPILGVRSCQRKLHHWNGPKDLRVIAYLIWDSRYFYFAVDVDDDVFFPTGEGKNTWGGDSVQCSFDIAGKGIVIDFQYTIALSPKEGPGIFYTFGGSGRVQGAKVAIRRKTRNAGAIYEIAIPWKSLKGYHPKVGKTIRFTFLVNDNDGSGRDGWIEWTPGIGDITEAFLFPRIHLVKKRRLDTVNFELALEKTEHESNSGVIGTYYIYSSKDIFDAYIAMEVKNGTKLLFSRQIPVKIRKGLNRISFSYPKAQLLAGENEIFATFKSKEVNTQLVCKENIFVIDKASLLQRIDQLEHKYQNLSTLISKLKAKGLDTAYLNLSLSVGHRFLPGLKEDFRKGRYEVAERKTQSLTRSVDKAITNGKNLLSNPSLNRPVPIYDMSKIKIRNGGFFIDNNPVFLFGPVAWLSAHDIEEARFGELGFNAYEEVHLGPWWMNDNEKTLNRQKMKTLIDRLNAANRQNLFYELLLSLHYLPKWFKDRYPDAWIRDRGNQFIPIVLDHPATRKLVKTYLEQVVKQVKDCLALGCYSLLNEAAYSDYNDYSKYSIDRFRKWLKYRHGTIKRLNMLWGTNYKSFDEVQPPPKSITVPTRQQINDAIWYDWQSFNDYRYTEFCRWCKKIIRATDPNTPFMVETNPVPRGGGTGESISLISEINCTDREGTYDFFRSVCPDKPVFDTEFHYDFSPWLPRQYFEYEVWKAFLHGCDGMLIWVWHNQRPMSITKEPEKMEGFAKAALDIQRLGKLVHAFQHSQAEIAILVTNPTYHSRTKRFFWFILQDILQAANGADAHYDIITDRLIDKGKLSNYKLLIAYRTDYVTRNNFKRIVKFIKNGGHLIIIGNKCLTKDEYGNERNINTLLSNKNRVFYLNVKDVKPSMNSLWNKKFSANIVRKLSLKLDRIYQIAKIYRPILCLNAKENTLTPEVEMQAIKYNGKYYAYLINHSEKNIKTVILMKNMQPITPIRELINYKPINGKRIALKPMEVAIYELR